MSILTSSTPVPIIYVSHLPSASSFYASLTQPLGIQFLSAAPTSPACLNFGYHSPSPSGPRKTVVFSVTQASNPSLSHIILSAPSPKAVLDFWAKSQILNKDYRRGENVLEKGTDEERAVTRDFDGNMVEAVFDAKRGRGGQRMGIGEREGVIELETASSEKEARRVLQWQEQVARSVGDRENPKSRGDIGGSGDGRGGHCPPTMRRSDSYPLPVRERERIDPSRVVRRETITETYRAPDTVTKEKKDTGFSGTAVLGTLLGAAALAGVAYAFSSARSESPEPYPTRRASEGARAASHYTQAQPQPIPVERIPARSYVSERDRDGGERKQARYLQYTITPGPPLTRAHTMHELERIEERGHHSDVVARSERGITMVDNEIGERSSRVERESQSGRARTILREDSPERSLAPPASSFSHRERDRERELEFERERDEERERERERERDPSPSRESHVSKRSHRSHRSHKSSASVSSRSRVSLSEKEKRYHENPESSYTSAHSHHTSSTVKLSPPAVPIPPPAASIVSTSTVRASRKEGGSTSGRRRRNSTSHSHAHSSHGSERSGHREARHVPLPESVSGASDWDRGSVRMVSGLGREYNEYVAGKGRRGYGPIGLDRAGLEELERLSGGFGGGPGPGYAASVAPSDSISSVGLKRERDRLRERMAGRGGDGRGERMERERNRGLVGGGSW